MKVNENLTTTLKEHVKVNEKFKIKYINNLQSYLHELEGKQDNLSSKITQIVKESTHLSRLSLGCYTMKEKLYPVNYHYLGNVEGTVNWISISVRLDVE